MAERISERVLYQRLIQQKHQTDCFDAAKGLVVRASDNSSFPGRDWSYYLEFYAFRVVRHVADFFSLNELKTPSTLLASALISDLVDRGIYTYDEVAVVFKLDFRAKMGKNLRPDSVGNLEEMVGDFTRMCLKDSSLPSPFIEYSKSSSTYQSRVLNQIRRLERSGVEPCAIALGKAVVLAEDIVEKCEINSSLSAKTKTVQDYLNFAKRYDLKYFVRELEKSFKILDNTLAVELKSPSYSDLEGLDLE